MYKKYDYSKVKELAETGLTVPEIAKILKLKDSGVRQYCRNNNIIINKAIRKCHNFKDETGNVYTHLTVLERAEHKDNIKIAMWKCKCTCGNITEVRGADLRLGKTRTCGCKYRSQSKRNFQGYKDIPRTYWSAIYYGAKQRYIEFNITIEYIQELYEKQEKKCKLSGLDISLDLKNTTASLDRIDSKKGYIEGNVQWVHKKINKIKSVLNEEEFIFYCCKVAEHVSKTNV